MGYGKKLTTRRFWSMRWTSAIPGYPGRDDDGQAGDLYLCFELTDGPTDQVARQRELRARIRPEQLDRLASVVAEAIERRDRA